LVLGTAFGNVERTMAFLARGHERGPRHVPPAEFPHLVPSAPAGNASVYAGLSGPVFAVSALAQSGEAAFAAACELIELGVATQVVAGAIAPRDSIVERVLGPLLDPNGFGAVARGEGAGFTLLTELSQARAGGRLLAEVLGRYAGSLGTSAGLAGVPEPDLASSNGVVLGVAGPELRHALAGSAWGAVPCTDLAREHGYHEALGAVAFAVAVERVASGELERVLVLSGTGASFSATLCGRVGREE
jgi:acetyl-CoA acetyltransferase